MNRTLELLLAHFLIVVLNIKEILTCATTACYYNSLNNPICCSVFDTKCAAQAIANNQVVNYWWFWVIIVGAFLIIMAIIICIVVLILRTSGRQKQPPPHATLTPNYCIRTEY